MSGETDRQVDREIWESFLYTKKFWMGSKKETREKMGDEWGDETNWQTGRQTKMGEGRDWEQGDKKKLYTKRRWDGRGRKRCRNGYIFVTNSCTDRQRKQRECLAETQASDIN